MDANDLPSPLSWDARTNSTYPMPGGHSAYLQSLKEVCDWVDEQSLSSEELAGWVSKRFEVSETSGRLTETFMRRAGIIDSDSGVLSLNDLTRRWLKTGDARIPVAIVHSRIRFVGEMLAELREPKSTQELLIAARRYGLTWNTPTQIHERRGWLQSAGLVEPANGRLVITAAGTSLLSQLTLHDPEGPAPLDPVPVHPATVVDQASPAEADQLANEIEDAATDSTNSARFEKAITQALGSSQEEIQDILDTLAHPIVGAVDGNDRDGYLLATGHEVCRRRLLLLGDEMVAVPPAGD